MALGTAVIVGVGPGIGLELARAFADAGHPVAMLARDKAKLDTYAAELASGGHTARGYAADVADPDSLRAALGSAISELGAPDVLIYSVAVLRRDSPVGGEHGEWIYNTAVNALGAKVAVDAVLPELRNGRGSLFFTGGGYALRPSKDFASLSVGKAALRAYVQVLHNQLAGTGVHATSVTVTATLESGAGRFDPAVLARTYVDLHQQPEGEWQHELVY